MVFMMVMHDTIVSFFRPKVDGNFNKKLGREEEGLNKQRTEHDLNERYGFLQFCILNEVSKRLSLTPSNFSHNVP
jgi:hypothetical protein